MGVRCVFVSEDVDVRWPLWFVTKWYQHVHIRPDSRGLISSRLEATRDDTVEDLALDIQRAVDWERLPNFTLVFLFECHGVSTCRITKEQIQWREADTWDKRDKPSHYYCTHEHL